MLCAEGRPDLSSMIVPVNYNPVKHEHSSQEPDFCFTDYKLTDGYNQPRVDRWPGLSHYQHFNFCPSNFPLSPPGCLSLVLDMSCWPCPDARYMAMLVTVAGDRHYDKLLFIPFQSAVMWAGELIGSTSCSMTHTHQIAARDQDPAAATPACEQTGMQEGRAHPR